MREGSTENDKHKEWQAFQVWGWTGGAFHKKGQNLSRGKKIKMLHRNRTRPT